MQEFEVDYTTCERADVTDNSTTFCSEVLAKNPGFRCVCRLKIVLEENFKRDVFIYYGLTNFYQNHRRYVKSRDDYQLLGHIRANSECNPFSYRLDPVDGISKPIMPCGAIANSIFNDTFKLDRLDGNMFREVPLTYTGIAWATDKKNKFRNPPLPPGTNNLALAFNGTIKPKDWDKPVYELDRNDTNNNGLQNEKFIVWMRTSAFPTFRKLYARVAHDKRDHDLDYQEGLASGEYRLTINYSKQKHNCDLCLLFFM